MNWYVTGYGDREVQYPSDARYGAIAECRSMMVDAIEDWLDAVTDQKELN